MNKINNILKYIYIIIGFFIVVYIIYIRLFLTRNPKDLQFNPLDNTYNIKIFLVILSSIICINIIINNLLIILKLESTQKYFRIIITKVTLLIENSLKQFYTSIVLFYDKLYNNRCDFISKLSRKFYDFWHVYPEYYLLFIAYAIRILILLIFLFEIFIIFKLNYFYKSLTLLCVTLFFNFLLFLLKDFAELGDTYKDALNITHVSIDVETQLPITNYSLKSEYQDNDLEYVVNEFILCNKLSGYLEMYDKYVTYFNPRFNIIIYSLYLVGWLYVLYINLISYF